MRLGGPVFSSDNDPERWAAAVRAAGYGAAYCPCSPEDSDSTLAAYRAAADARDVLIAEVGAWSNPISPNHDERRKAFEKCVAALSLAERLGVRSCVNIAGSRSAEHWDGPHPENLTRATFDLIVENVRAIIDAVKPKRTCYALETMPWIFPDSAESYLRLLRAVDRPAFGVHFDPVNLVNCPERVYDTRGLIRGFFEKLGPHIRSIHAKDVRIASRLTFHVDECPPGEGVLDYEALLTGAEILGPDTPVMLEHLPSEAAYTSAAEHLRAKARACEVELR